MADQPKVSVVMPVRNEAGFIRTSLEAVLAQDYPADRIEILVLDGMSTDGTREVVESIRAQHRRVRLLDNPGRIVPTGLNVAMGAATGEVIVRVDGHCKIAPDYVRRCVEHLQRDGVDGVGGPVETKGATRVARAIALAMSSRFGVGGSAFRTVKDRFVLADTVPFPAYTRAIMERAGPYDEEQVRNQDDEYNYRLRKMGAKLLLAPDVRSEYYSRSSIRTLWRQYYQYGYWKVRVLQKHPRQMSVRQLVPAAFVAAMGGSVLVAPVAGPLPFVSLAGAYVVANLAASYAIAREEDASLLPIVAAACATLHVSYGAGFLVGLVRFWDRWGAAKNDPARLRSAPRAA